MLTGCIYSRLFRYCASVELSLGRFGPIKALLGALLGAPVASVALEYGEQGLGFRTRGECVTRFILEVTLQAISILQCHTLVQYGKTLAYGSTIYQLFGVVIGKLPTPRPIIDFI